MSVFDDPSLDDRARAIVVGHGKRTLGDASLEAAALLHDAPSPAMLEGDAEWIESELAAAGFTPEQITRLYEHAATRAYKKEVSP